MNHTPTYSTRAIRLGRQRGFPAKAMAFAFFASVTIASLQAATAPAAAPATASTSATSEEPIQLEKFVQTGTRFNDRTVIDSPVPIDVITRNDLSTGGYSETAQVLQTLVP